MPPTSRVTRTAESPRFEWFAFHYGLTCIRLAQGICRIYREQSHTIQNV